MRTRPLLKSRDELIEIPLLPNGNALCPVCGIEISDQFMPWEGDDPREKSADDPDFVFASGSDFICNCCGIQWGFEDAFSEPSMGMTQEDTWERLRLRWLDRVNWRPSALNQLRDNLGIDIDALCKKRDDNDE